MSDLAAKVTRIQQERPAAFDLTKWVGAVTLTFAIAIAYFIAARLSLELLTKPEGVAVFWPAAGVSAGALIVLGSRARWPVVFGTVAATILANMLGDRNIWGAVFFGCCNAFEAALTAWLIDPLPWFRFHPGQAE
jgi:integral membrane sensor domain MASE1